MSLNNWLSDFKRTEIWVGGDVLPAGTPVSDTRRIQNEPVVFFARRGVSRDGHDFLPTLLDHPMIQAFVVEKWPFELKTTKPVVMVSDTTLALALAIKSYEGDPTASAFCCAVTGTNGKTTTTYLVESLLTAAGKRVARMGTIETAFEGQSFASDLTTPDFTDLQQKFSALGRQGANALVFEASSHALDQRRLLGVELDVAFFTHLTQDHLDYHQTMDRYFLAKQKLFTEVLRHSKKKRKIAIVRDDESYGSRLIEELRSIPEIDLLTWSWSRAASSRSLQILSSEVQITGGTMRVSGLGFQNQEFKTPLVGRFNLENIAQVIVLGAALQLDSKTIQSALLNHRSVPGRLERVGSNVIVDYAHTPDALENVLSTLRPLTKGRLKVLFGCGGDRDRTKRPQMGAVAELYADEIFVTSDNPRSEDPEAILRDIVSGMQRIKKVSVEVDRRVAIQVGVQSLQHDDVLLIAGKGHETTQQIGDQKLPFDDREVAKLALQA